MEFLTEGQSGEMIFQKQQFGFILLELIKGVLHTLVFLSIALLCIYGIECIKCGLDSGYAP